MHSMLRLNLEIVLLVVLRLEICWLLVAIALRVDCWYNGERNPGMRESGTASATFISASNGQEVLIGNVMSVASGLQLLHHEEVLLADSLHDTVLHSLVWHIVSDSAKRKLKKSSLFSVVSGSNSSLGLISKSEGLVEGVTISSDVNLLLDG